MLEQDEVTKLIGKQIRADGFMASRLTGGDTNKEVGSKGLQANYLVGIKHIFALAD